MNSTCTKCKKNFEWQFDDALLVIGYGKYYVPCPHCKKLVRIVLY